MLPLVAPSGSIRTYDLRRTKFTPNLYGSAHSVSHVLIGGRKMAKILIVDDDPDIVESLKVVLEDKGHKVVSASDGSKGLKAVEKENPDLIILDVMMESRDKGFDVAREIRKNEKHKATPILMLTAIEGKTGLSFKDEAGDESWLPVDDYVEKPIKPDDLIARVEKLLKKR